MTRAVVFAYHHVGVRCLKVLIAHGVEIALVVTHDDSPNEVIWFDSVAATAADYEIATIKPANPNNPNIVRYIHDIAPDFLFSFYYRQMLSPELLAISSRGALNMHGSLLPKYRGRVPVNWAILNGETQTGATLHYMVEKPDAGDIVAQTAVPILPDDTAKDVFNKVTVAAELTLHHALPVLIAGNAPRVLQDLQQGSYFSGRTPEDGRINWHQSASQIHNLIRAVAPPYPGALTMVANKPARILRSLLIAARCEKMSSPLLVLVDNRLIAYCANGDALQILALEIAGEPVTPITITLQLGSGPWQLGND